MDNNIENKLGILVDPAASTTPIAFGTYKMNTEENAVVFATAGTGCYKLDGHYNNH